MARIFAAKTIGGFRPIDEPGEEVVRKIKRGEVVSIEIKRPRNVAFHRKYWALVTIVHANLDHDRYPSAEDFHAALKICAGLRTRIVLPDGTEGFIPGSIAFHKMSEDDFSAFFDRVCRLVSKHFLPGVDEDALRAEVEELIGAATPEVRR
jgi:hypothetical protein